MWLQKIPNGMRVVVTYHFADGTLEIYEGQKTSTWAWNWRKYETDYNVGDELTYYGILYGLASNINLKEVDFALPLNKSMYGITGANVTVTRNDLRIIVGTTVSDFNSAIADFNIAHVSGANNNTPILWLRLTKKDGTAFVNQLGPVILRIGFKVTFT